MEPFAAVRPTALQTAVQTDETARERIFCE